MEFGHFVPTRSPSPAARRGTESDAGVEGDLAGADDDVSTLLAAAPAMFSAGLRRKSSRLEEPSGGTVAPTLACMNRAHHTGGITWAQCALVKIDGAEASASFSGGGQGDVPTVRGAAIIGDGGHGLHSHASTHACLPLPIFLCICACIYTVWWDISIVKKLSSSMRIGVQSPSLRVGSNWNDKMSFNKCWYLDADGDMVCPRTTACMMQAWCMYAYVILQTDGVGLFFCCAQLWTADILSFSCTPTTHTSTTATLS